MTYLFEVFPFAPGTRMTGIWDFGASYEADVPTVAMASLVKFGEDQDGILESDFLAAYMPYRLAGFHGVGPDGQAWAVMIQAAPMSAAESVGAITAFWPMMDGLDRGLHYNWDAWVREEVGWTRDVLLEIYADDGVAPTHLADWSVQELVLGLLAECGNVPLPQIVAGRVIQCAFPDLDHECQHDVFRDVFYAWQTDLLPVEEPVIVEEEPEPEVPVPVARPTVRGSGPRSWAEKDLRRKSTKQLRKLAYSGHWKKSKIRNMSRKKLIRLLSTPHWRNGRQAPLKKALPPRPHDWKMGSP